jgi:hypothetical protein
LVAKCYRWSRSQPVKLSDGLVLDARLTGEIAERSIAGQIEYWANLGRAIEPLLQGTQALALCRKAVVRPLSECLETVDSRAGKRRSGQTRMGILSREGRKGETETGKANVSDGLASGGNFQPARD